jgi:hypothetical protein
MLDIALAMLQPAINMGLTELEFWEMTKAEIERYLEGALWRMKAKAQFDYSLADLFGASVARLFDSSNEFPAIHQVYPYLFEEEAIEEEKQEAATTNSINNFLAFAMKHNAKMKGVEDEEL